MTRLSFFLRQRQNMRLEHSRRLQLQRKTCMAKKYFFPSTHFVWSSIRAKANVVLWSAKRALWYESFVDTFLFPYTLGISVKSGYVCVNKKSSLLGQFFYRPLSVNRVNICPPLPIFLRGEVKRFFQLWMGCFTPSEPLSSFQTLSICTVYT